MLPGLELEILKVPCAQVCKSLRYVFVHLQVRLRFDHSNTWPVEERSRMDTANQRLDAHERLHNVLGLFARVTGLGNDISPQSLGCIYIDADAHY